jgi:hypothetical protein
VLIASAQAETIYVVDHYNGRILKYTADGIGSVFASSLNPYGIAVDKAGNVFVVEAAGLISGIGTNVIWKFTPGGSRSFFAGATNINAWGLAVDSKNNVYLADNNGTIQKFMPNGLGSVFASGLNSPYGLACDNADNIFVGNSGDGSIWKFTPNGSGSVFVPSNGQDSPTGLACDNAGNLYAGWQSNAVFKFSVLKFTPAGVGSVFTDSVFEPEGLAFDAQTNLFVVEHSSSTVEKFTPDGIGSVFANGGDLFIAIYQQPEVAPFIVTSSGSQSAEAGANVDFDVKAGGTSLRYSWYFNQTNLLNQSSNSMMELTNVQFVQSGTYTVVVTNVVGAVTSAPAMLQVIAPVDRRPVPALNVTGQAGTLLNLVYAESLGPELKWTNLASVTLSSPPQYYFDLTLPQPPLRLYRAWQSAGAGLVPSLDVHMVPAIMLTGNIGDSLRLDYINRFGPTDAWVTLDTVTLTNTSQLYFDVSALEQPQRLYRLVP